MYNMRIYVTQNYSRRPEGKDYKPDIAQVGIYIYIYNERKCRDIKTEKAQEQD